MFHERFEVCVYSAGEDDYVVAKTCTDSSEALMYLKGLTELSLDACLRYYSWTD